jgi:hypothetical protein
MAWRDTLFARRRADGEHRFVNVFAIAVLASRLDHQEGGLFRHNLPFGFIERNCSQRRPPCLAFPLLNALRLIERPIRAGVNTLHEIVDTRLSGRGPFRVMLPDDFRRVAENVGDFLEAGTAAEEFRCKRVPEPVSMSAWHVALSEGPQSGAPRCACSSRPQALPR